MRATPVATMADVLTGSRLVLAPIIAVAIAIGSFDVAAAVMCAGWLTDFFDGRLARLAGGRTRLGSFDIAADATMGVGVIAGLTAAERLDPFVAIVGSIVLLGSAAAQRNVMPAMVFMALADLALISTVFAHGTWGGPLIVTVLLVILAFDHDRLLVLIPAFIGGFRRLVGGNPTDPRYP